MALLWLILMTILLLIEATTLGITTIWFALGALVASFFAAFNSPLWFQFVIFGISSLVLLVFTRPILVEKMEIGQNKTNLDLMQEYTGIVIKQIEPFSTGQVRVNGSVWTAISVDNKIIPIDTEVKVLDIEGVKLIVEKTKKEKEDN